MLRINVAHHLGQYPIYIGENLLHSSSLFALTAGKKVMIVSNENIAQHYLSPLLHTLKQQNCHLFTCFIAEGEAHKNLATANQIYTALLEKNCGRDSLLIALGGGVIGDIVGFVASTYQRGIAFIQIPTTLLAQVDASVGGKTAVNHPLGKNMIGAFYPPKAVIIDVNTLQTLPEREFSAGLAEVIKYGAILDKHFLGDLHVQIPLVKACHLPTLKSVIARCCQMKAHIVEQDEKEQGIRALLNFGHTFGHAIESHMGYGEWLHGEAVSVGMRVASELSHQLHPQDFSSYQRAELCELLQKADLPVCIPHTMTTQNFLYHMGRDKKVQAGKMRLILLSTLGQGYVANGVSEAQIEQALKACY